MNNGVPYMYCPLLSRVLGQKPKTGIEPRYFCPAFPWVQITLDLDARKVPSGNNLVAKYAFMHSLPTKKMRGAERCSYRVNSTMHKGGHAQRTLFVTPCTYLGPPFPVCRRRHNSSPAM